jgi:hypothetical protein
MRMCCARWREVIKPIRTAGSGAAGIMLRGALELRSAVCQCRHYGKVPLSEFPEGARRWYYAGFVLAIVVLSAAIAVIEWIGIVESSVQGGGGALETRTTRGLGKGMSSRVISGTVGETQMAR